MQIFWQKVLPLILPFFLSGVLVSCLNVPNGVDTETRLQSIKVLLINNSGDSLENLQTKKNDSFKLLLQVKPDTLKDYFTCKWFKGKKELKNGFLFEYIDSLEIPDSVSVTDKANNTLGKSFSVITNAPPVFTELLTPQEGDTLKGYKNTAFKFEWRATDEDSDTLYYTIEIDGNKFPTGIWNYTFQGGFDSGAHSVKIIVKDNYLNADSSKTVTFYVQQ